MKIIYSSLIIGALVLSSSCKKDSGEPLDDNNGNGSGSGSSVVEGCKDLNSPNYNPSATSEDGSCKFLYITNVQVTSFPADNNGDDWDWGLTSQQPADLFFRMKESSETSWKLETERVDNATAGPLDWSVSPPFKLTNKTWEWEIVDYDATSSDDVMDSGTFNPVSQGSSGVITSSTGNTTIKIFYQLM